MKASQYHRDDDVSVDILAQAFEESGLSASELAKRLEWFHPDTQRVRQTLGLRRCHDNPKNVFRMAVRYETAVKMIRAMGHDPVDYDL